VVVDVDMLRAVMEHWVLSEGNGRHIVHPDLWRCSFYFEEISEKTFNPDSLACGNRRYDVLCFTRRQRDDLLLGGLPSDWAVPKEEDDATGALPGVVKDRYGEQERGGVNGTR
jgi:hypothetical protein